MTSTVGVLSRINTWCLVGPYIVILGVLETPEETASPLFGEALAPKPDWYMARTFSIGRSGNISQRRKRLSYSR